MITTLFIAFGVSQVIAYPTSYFDKLDKMPDYWQLDPYFGNKGQYNCGPVAAANSIMYFDKTLDDNIVPDDDWKKLVDTLASQAYMNTDYDNPDPTKRGTSFGKEEYGINKYLDDNFAPGFDVKSQWWDRTVAQDIGWIKEELSQCEDVILLIGWWDLNGTWHREGGHYVTLAAYDQTSFWISDPSNQGPSHDSYTLAQIDGFWSLQGYGSHNAAIIEGAISASPIPEPCTIILLGSGILGIGGYRFRRKKRA
jgi:hypothetical protein